MRSFPGSSRHRLHLLGCVLLLVVCGLLWPWTAIAEETGQQPKPPTEQRPSGAQASEQASPPETRITPEQATELFRSVDDILKFASDVTRLPIKNPVKRELASREQVRSFIHKNMEEDEGVQRLRRSEASLKKFGLVPRDFDLRGFMLELLTSEVAGYYDPKSKTVYLLDWVPPDVQRPVLAHELTHALQDQNFDLEKWLKVRPDKKLDDQDTSTYGPEEEQAARQAVSEGQAMLVLVDYTIGPSGRSPQETRLLTEFFRRNTIEYANTSPVFSRAPLYLREAVIFSYTYGLSFVQNLLAEGGKSMAFSRPFRNPPLHTRHIMEPQTYITGEQVVPLRLPKLTPILDRQYERFDLGTVGEFDVWVLLKQFAGDAVAERLSSKWRGGTYYLGRKRNGAPLARNGLPAMQDLSLLYLSRWATPDDAQRFADTYVASLPKRYKSVDRLPVEKGRNTVVVPDGATRITEEGRVIVEVADDRVLVMENFDQTTAVKLRNAVLADSIASFEPLPSHPLATPVLAMIGRSATSLRRFAAPQR